MPDAILHVPTSAAFYDAALSGLQKLNEEILMEGLAPASLFDTGAVYKTEPRETWRHAIDVANEKWGDCEDLAAYRAAELVVSGEDPGARVVTYKTGPRRYHAVVERGSGVIEDPSLALGMKVPKGREEFYAMMSAPRSPYDGAEAMMGEDDGTGTVTIDVYKSGRGWTAVVKFPMPSGRAILSKTSTSSSPKEAEKKAANQAVDLAKTIANNPLVKAALPPQAALAVQALQNPQVQNALKTGAAVLSKVPGVSSLKHLF